jgi:predicted  nucleic acid-binding Zn-ribbon protein
MKELDALGAEIDTLKRDRIRLEQEKMQKEADIKTRGTEISTLQKELEVLAAAAKKLESQKVDAQKRLDDLDKKKLKLEATLQESENRCAEELRQVEELQAELTATEKNDKNKDVDLRLKREELHALRQDELQLELKVEKGHDTLVQLMKFVRASQTDIEQAEYVVTRLQEMSQMLHRTSDQLDLLMRGELSADEAARRGLLAESWPLNIDMDVFSHDSILNRPGFSRAPDGELRYEPQLDSSREQTDDTGQMQDDSDFGPPPPGADPFTEALESVTAKKSDSAAASAAASNKPQRPPPLGEDPWSYSRLITKAQNDPFAMSEITNAKSPVNPEDPFGTGSFAPDDSSKGLQPGGNKPPRPKSPGPARPKSPAPPTTGGGRPKSPVPPGRPKSPAPGRPKSPSTTGSKPKPAGGAPPPRPAAPPCKSPSSFRGDNGAASGSLRNGGGGSGSSPNILSPGAADPSYSDFSVGQYSTDEPTSWD